MATHRPLHIGLTGNIASGKSAVAQRLAALGATIIDADLLARDAVRVGTPEYAAIVRHFGPTVTGHNGELDRAVLRKMVFDDVRQREALNAIVHPAVGRLRDLAFRAASVKGAEIVVSDIPLLFEVGLAREFDGVIVVDAPPALRLRRLMDHRGLAESAAQAMIDAQWPSEDKRRDATWVIDNDGTPEQLDSAVAALWTAMRQLARRQRLASPTS